MLPADEDLAGLLAGLAAESPAPDDDVTEMVIGRVIDDAAVAAASLTRAAPSAARAQALAHPVSIGGDGATVFGVDSLHRASPEWAAWANAVAVRELDYHDTFLAAEYAHPGDNIPPLVAVAQHVGAGHASSLGRNLTGADLVRAIAIAYEVQIDLARAIDLHSHGIDHVAHLGPSVAAGLGGLLGLDVAVTRQAIGQALHTSIQTRQSRKGAISSWKAFAPAFAGKSAIEAVDRAMRGQAGPAPIYEGEDSVLARLLDGPEASYEVSLPEPGEQNRAILDSYTKQHSAEYQAQAWIDLAIALRKKYPLLLDDAENIVRIVLHTSDHTHTVIGSGSNDPQKYDPGASRETLDHSVPYIFAVALQDGAWHHLDSYTPERAHRADTVALWQKITTVEDEEWTARYHATDPAERAFGGRVEIELVAGAAITEEIAVADAHPHGARPFGRAEYVAKFRTLSEGVLDPQEADRFLALAARLPELTAAELRDLTFTAQVGVLASVRSPSGIF